MSARMLSRWMLVSGIVLFLAAFFWPYVLPGSALYDDSQAIELNNASESLHETMHAHEDGHEHDHFGEVHKEESPEIAAAAKRYREAQTKLDSAKFWTSSVPVYLRWSGVAVYAIGVAAFFTTRQV